MLSPNNTSTDRLDQMPESQQEQQRLQTLAETQLLEAGNIPVFEEATQTTAHFLGSPICVLSLLDRDREWFKSAVGLSRLGLMNQLAASRQLLLADSFGLPVVNHRQIVAIADTMADPVYADSILAKQYGICAYLGVPLLTSSGICLGTLAVMELSPRQFTHQDIDFLQLMARWSMSEFERDQLLKQQSLEQPFNYSDYPINAIKAQLIAQMTQELCTPLTSILGMGSVLSQGIYGTLTEKQREYIDIIHNSGQYLLSLVNEIVELGMFDEADRQLSLTPVDVEMLCQQAIGTLNQVAERREQQIRLTVEPGPRIWLLDKDKVRQMIYHLIFSVIQSCSAGGTIRLHISRKQNNLHLSVWVSHPWLSDGLSSLPNRSLTRIGPANPVSDWTTDNLSTFENQSMGMAIPSHDLAEYENYFESAHPPRSSISDQLETSRQNLGLTLSRQLAELQGGSLMVRGSADEGYRYVIRLPQIQGENKR